MGGPEKILENGRNISVNEVTVLYLKNRVLIGERP